MVQSLFTGEKLTCIRGGRTVFTGLDLSISQGEALVLEGPNGSGKSSLIRLLSGLVRPRSGHLFWHGQDVTREPEIYQQQLHYIGHRNAIKPVLTVLENLSYWAGFSPEKPSDLSRLEQALIQFNMLALKDTPANLLSSGQSRRLALSRLLATEKALWLLDEPSVGLDVNSVALLETAICAHRAKGGAVILATHTEIGLDTPQRINLSNYSPLYNTALLKQEHLEESWI
ncbi:heme ABC exporter ATP-binding protein CcmA [Kiloniella laminariae]|uniref:Heme ABC exporter ATP-binding protein CcmA n=1 Tax=Kiloniella laminariae TaxID=454162 RepID=A0ABT4LIK7_9PROT|nr:heme ABC exporter ATP-binding protein CcmA [Kiloniella laminariae]MCZ4280934.1 heme ABC exporter ATP-binding protein CcmA [Kiloniella laminariae]